MTVYLLDGKDMTSREKAYRIKFFSKEEYEEHRDLLKELILSAMRNHRMTPKRLRPVYPNMHYNSGVFLCECVKDGGEGMSVLPPLFVRDDEGGYTAEILKAYEPDGHI